MPQKEKKDKKIRSDRYEKKVAIPGTFEQAIKFLADKANRNVASGTLAAAKK